MRTNNKNLKTPHVIALCILCSIFTNNLQGKEVRVTTSSTIPPYSSTAHGGSGIVVDVLKTCLEEQKLSPKFTYAANNIIAQSLPKDTADVVYPVASIEDPFYLSDNIIHFNNTAITLRLSNFNINTVQDLKGLRIIAFKNAGHFLGSEYKEFIESGGPREYHEVTKQNEQIAMLLNFEADAIVMDRDVFIYHFMKYKQFLDKLNYSTHFIFPSLERYAAFRSKEQRDEFNKCLQSIKDNGKFEEIYNQYMKFK